MPIDQPEASVTTRRSFLTRSAAAGAVVAAVAATGVAGGFGGVGQAGAQAGGDSGGDLENPELAATAIPFELSAVQAYQAALSGPTLDATWTKNLQTFQAHHQEVVTTLTALIPTTSTDPAPIPDAGVIAQFAPGPNDDQQAVLAQLAGLEAGLAATHLDLIHQSADNTTAKTLARILGTESQQAVSLGLASGADIESLTPANVSIDDALKASTGSAPASTTSTTAKSTTGN